MSGFDNEVMYAKNADFTTAGAGGGSASNGLVLDGQIWIGRTVVNAGGTHIDVGTITAGSGVSITNGAGSIIVSAGSSVPTTFTTDDASTATPSANNLNLFGTTAQGLTSSASGSTVTYTIADWTTTQKGVGVLATNAETIAGTSTTKVVTPDDLKAKLGSQTNHGLPIGAGTTGALTWTSAPTAGQLLIGTSATTDPTLGTLTAGTGISITNASGSITISGTGGAFTWVNQTADLSPLVKGNAYEANKGTLLTLTLPTGGTFGDQIRIQGFGAGGWILNAGTGQTIQVNNSASTVAGSVASTNRYDYIELVCSTTTTTWLATDSGGNLTIA